MNLKIESPCPENWAGMMPDATGRYCSVCTKSVHDFTDKPKEELLAFLLCSTSSPCVRMLASQERFTAEEVQTVAQKIVRSGKPLSAAALALVTMLAVGCQSENPKAPMAPTADGMVVTALPVDTPQAIADTVGEPMILGRMLPPKAAGKRTPKVTEPLLIVEVPEPVWMGAPPDPREMMDTPSLPPVVMPPAEPVLMGDVAMPPSIPEILEKVPSKPPTVPAAK